MKNVEGVDFLKLLTLAIAPSIAILAYIYTKDKYDKEPMKYLLLLFLFGCLTVIPAIILELLFSAFTGLDSNSDLFSVLIDAVIGVALVEEGVKFFVLWTAAWKRGRYFNQMFDGIVYSVFISLGFATVENIMYVLQNGYTTGIMRALTAVPLHAICGVAMGYYMGIGKFRLDNRDKGKYLALSFFIPVLIHGIYDFLVLSDSIILIISCIPFLVFLYVFAFIKIKRHARYNHMIRDEETGRIEDLS